MDKPDETTAIIELTATEIKNIHAALTFTSDAFGGTAPKHLDPIRQRLLALHMDGLKKTPAR